MDKVTKTIRHNDDSAIQEQVVKETYNLTEFEEEDWHLNPGAEVFQDKSLPLISFSSQSRGPWTAQYQGVEIILDRTGINITFWFKSKEEPESYHLKANSKEECFRLLYNIRYLDYRVIRNFWSVAY